MGNVLWGICLQLIEHHYQPKWGFLLSQINRAGYGAHEQFGLKIHEPSLLHVGEAQERAMQKKPSQACDFQDKSWASLILQLL